jgi:hypothetical protein
MRSDFRRFMIRAGRAALDGVGALFVVPATFGSAYVAGASADAFGFGFSLVVAMSVMGFCVGWLASAAICMWIQMKLSPPPLHPDELFTDIGSH